MSGARRLIGLYALMCCLAIAGALGVETVKEKAERVITIQRNDHDDAKLVRAYGALTPAELNPERIRTYDTRTLELLFQATALAADASDRPSLTALLGIISDESFRRGFVGTMIEDLQRRYVAERDWSKLAALSARFPWAGVSVPAVRDSALPVTGPAVYDISTDGKSLVLQPVDIASHPTIVVVVSGACHFSREATDAIAADPKLSEVLAERAVYIDPSRYRIDLDGIAENNRTQAYKVRVLYKASGWPGLDFRRTPHFYFLRDGRVVFDVLGMDADIVAKLREGLAKIGLS